MEISVYYQHLYLLTVSLGRILLQNLALFDLIERLQEADEPGQPGSGQGVTALCPGWGLVMGSRQELQHSPGKEGPAHLMEPGVPPELSGPLEWKLSRGGTIQTWMLFHRASG